MNPTMASFSDIVSKYNENCKLRFSDEDMIPPSTMVDFSRIGGLNRHICTLRETVIFPLIYRDVYEKFNIRPPRGILFHGPPGTGKTLVARALVTELSRNTQVHVSFFSCKGSDILDKWVGESEKKLKTLFEKALNAHPSVIFFDEIDALAPIRCSRQDQVHTSVVATLLALMDGMDTSSSSGVIVIGATNRINAIDPALRRSGRFDRELYFPLPCMRSRLDILQIITKHWQNTSKPTAQFLKYLAEQTSGYCGADLQALCAEAVICCLKRTYPTIVNDDYSKSSNASYQHQQQQQQRKITININKLNVEECDFLNAHNTIEPVEKKYRSIQHRLPDIIQPLLMRQLDEIVNMIKESWPHFLDPDYQFKHDEGKRYMGRLIIMGNAEQGHTRYVAPALLHHLEHLPAHILDVQEIHENMGNRGVEEIIIQKFRLTRQCSPSILYAPNIDLLWNIVDHSTKAVFLSLLNELDPEMPLLIITTCNVEAPTELRDYFAKHCSLIYQMSNPNLIEREEFFASLFLEKALSLSITTNTTDHADNSKPVIRGRRYSKRIRGLEPTISTEHMNEGHLEYQKRSSSQNTAKRIKIEKIETNQLGILNSIYSGAVNFMNCKSTSTTHDNLYTLNDNNQREKCDNEESEIITDGFKSIIISRPRLLYLFQRITKDLTVDSTCVHLELLYDQLNTCIELFQNEVNRNSMLENIEIILKQHEENLKQYVK